MEVCKKFSDDSAAQWISDLTWVTDDEKVRALLLCIFTRRQRCSNLQARLWKRVIDLYWRAGWTKRQIAEQFGVGKEDVRRIVKSLRREAKDFFDLYGQPIIRPTISKPVKPPRVPISADPTNESPEHWAAVLASHGFYDPDKAAKGWRWQNPVYKFEWSIAQSSGEWGVTFGWAEFHEGFQASTEDERYANFIAHVPTVSDVDRAIDGDPEAKAYLREYTRLETQKYKIVPAINDPREGRPFIQTFAVPPCTSVGMDVWIDTNGTVRKRGTNQVCGHVSAELFFGATGLDESSMNTESDMERNTEMTMNHTQAAELIKRHDIPRSTVARLCRMHLSDLSGYLNGRTDVSQDKVDRISQVVDDIVRVIQAIPHKVDLRDPVNVRKLIVAVNDAAMQQHLFPLPESTALAVSAD